MDTVDIILIGAVIGSLVLVVYLAERGKSIKHLSLFAAVLSLFYILSGLLLLRILGVTIGEASISVN